MYVWWTNGYVHVYVRIHYFICLSCNRGLGFRAPPRTLSYAQIPENGTPLIKEYTLDHIRGPSII